MRLTPKIKQDIILKFKDGNWSVPKIAKRYKLKEETVQDIVNQPVGQPPNLPLNPIPQTLQAGAGELRAPHIPNVIRRTTEYLYDSGETHVEIHNYPNNRS